MIRRLVAVVAQLPPSGRPTVTVAATDASATEAGVTTGRFAVSRTGSTAAALTAPTAPGGGGRYAPSTAARVGRVFRPSGRRRRSRSGGAPGVRRSARPPDGRRHGAKSCKAADTPLPFAAPTVDIASVRVARRLTRAGADFARCLHAPGHCGDGADRARAQADDPGGKGASKWNGECRECGESPPWIGYWTVRVTPSPTGRPSNSTRSRAGGFA